MAPAEIKTPFPMTTLSAIFAEGLITLDTFSPLAMRLLYILSLVLLSPTPKM